MPIDQKKVDAINSLVVGWLQPIYYQDHPVTGRRLNGLGPSDFRKVMAGYACPDCLAEFRTYLAKCPVCGFERDIIADVQAPPQDWVEHLSDSQRDVEGVPLSFDEFMAEVARDPDIEHRKL